MCTRTITYKQLSASWIPTASPKYIDVLRPTINLQRLYGPTMWLQEHTCRYVIGFCCAGDEKGVSVRIVGTELVMWVGSWLAWGNLGEMMQVGGSVVIPEMDLMTGVDTICQCVATTMESEYWMSAGKMNNRTKKNMPRNAVNAWNHAGRDSIIVVGVDLMTQALMQNCQYVATATTRSE